MTVQETLDLVLRHYPRVWHAAHRRHPPRGLAGAALSEREQTVLAHLDPTRSRSVADLADHLALAPSTLSEVLGALEAKDLVVRTRDAPDRRKVSVSLTPRGKRALADATPLDASVLQKALETLSDTDRATVGRGLALLADALKETQP